MTIADLQNLETLNNLIFYLKYFILIREWFKEAQNEIPEHIDETIYYLGSRLCFHMAKYKDKYFNEWK